MKSARVIRISAQAAPRHRRPAHFVREMLLARSRATLPAISGHKPRLRGIAGDISRLLSGAHLQAMGATVCNQVLANQVACVSY